MAERGKSDLAPQRRSLKLSPSIGDWTTYKVPQQLVKRVKIGLYGFDRLSEEELNAAHLIHYRFAESWIKALRAGLGCAGELFSIEAQQMPYGNFVKSLTGPVLQGKITSPEYPEEIFLSVDSSLAEGLVAAALGGEAGGGRHQITEADQLVFETAFSENLNLLNTAFSNIFKSLKYEAVSFPDPAPLLSVNHQTTFVVFVLELTLGDAHGKALLGYTGPFLKGLLKKIKESSKPKPLPLNKLGPQILSNILVPVKALLGSAELKAGEIRGLEAGDVVTVNNSIFNAINIFLGGKKVVQGQPGEQNGKLVLRVVGVEKEKEIKVEPPPVQGPTPPPPPAPTPVKPAVPPPAAKPLPPLRPLRPAMPPPPPPIEEEEEEFPEEDLEDDLLDEEEFPEEDFEEEEEKEAS
ncbi:MAG: FliM/FliN family flagellar motor switch protein [Candidatus Margulisiibacteriota bacterium]